MRRVPEAMSVKEFREEGYLQELNRHFLHPLGLAISVDIDDNGNESLGAIQDFRSDPEGMIFGFEYYNEHRLEEAKRKMEFVAEQYMSKEHNRLNKHGFIIEPIWRE